MYENDIQYFEINNNVYGFYGTLTEHNAPFLL